MSEKLIQRSVRLTLLALEGTYGSCCKKQSGLKQLSGSNSIMFVASAHPVTPSICLFL